MGKEVNILKNLEYYKEKSPLLNILLDKNMSKDRPLWLVALNERIDEKHIAEFTEKFGTDLSEAVGVLTLMVWNFGLQDNSVDSTFATDITRSVLLIGYEIGDIGGVDTVLPKVSEQLKDVNYIYTGWLKERVPKIIAHKVVRGMLVTGAIYKAGAYDENDRLGPFSNFIKGLKI